jgi:hypothetical protein
MVDDSLPVDEVADSIEVEAHFLLERPESFVSKRMRMRLQRRLLKSAHLPGPKVLRSLLSAAEMDSIFAFANEVRDAMKIGGAVALHNTATAGPLVEEK